MRILLVEDDKVSLGVLRRTLLEQRHIVDTAVDGQTAWDYAQSTSYDLLLMGIKLPNIDGITISQRLRDQGCSTPILLLVAPDAIAEGEKVVISWTAQGTYKKEIKLLNFPPTFKSGTWTGISIYRIIEGKVVEERGEEDALGLMQQLGLITTVAQTES